MREQYNRQYDIFCKKNSDYGNSFELSLNRLGLVAGLVRMEDKMNRLSNLITNSGDGLVFDESVLDTLEDLSNYSAMTAAYIRGNESELSEEDIFDEVNFDGHSYKVVSGGEMLYDEKNDMYFTREDNPELYEDILKMSRGHILDPDNIVVTEHGIFVKPFGTLDVSKTIRTSAGRIDMGHKHMLRRLSLVFSPGMMYKIDENNFYFLAKHSEVSGESTVYLYANEQAVVKAFNSFQKSNNSREECLEKYAHSFFIDEDDAFIKRLCSVTGVDIIGITKNDTNTFIEYKSFETILISYETGAFIVNGVSNGELYGRIWFTWFSDTNEVLLDKLGFTPYFNSKGEFVSVIYDTSDPNLKKNNPNYEKIRKKIAKSVINNDTYMYEEDLKL